MDIDELAHIGLVINAQKYGETEPLIRAFERGDTWVIEDESARKILLRILRGTRKKGRNKNRDIEKKHESISHYAGWLRGYLGEDAVLYENTGDTGTITHILARSFHMSESRIREIIKDKRKGKEDGWLSLIGIAEGRSAKEIEDEAAGGGETS